VVGIGRGVSLIGKRYNASRSPSGSVEFRASSRRASMRVLKCISVLKAKTAYLTCEVILKVSNNLVRYILE